jgi:multidrug efflux pump subunit AcrB
MWIVRLALRRNYTFVVVALLIGVLGLVSINRMSTDILPSIDIPAVSVVWQYYGMPADEIETRIVYVNERVLTASVNDIEHIESRWSCTRVTPCQS